MNLRGLWDKKVRGKRHRTKSMIYLMKKMSEQFPDADLEEGYWHMHLPVAESFIDSSKTPGSIRRTCMQLLVDRCAFLAAHKPVAPYAIRVVALITWPRIWDSELIVYFGEQHWNGYFKRNNFYQKWIPLPQGHTIPGGFHLQLPDSLVVRGYHEILHDEESHYERDLWFIGDLHEIID
jgi:hypothetical protein